MKLKPKKFKITKFGKYFLTLSWFMFWGGGSILFGKLIDWTNKAPSGTDVVYIGCFSLFASVSIISFIILYYPFLRR